MFLHPHAGNVARKSLWGLACSVITEWRMMHSLICERKIIRDFFFSLLAETDLRVTESLNLGKTSKII